MENVLAALAGGATAFLFSALVDLLPVSQLTKAAILLATGAGVLCAIWL